MKTCRCLLCNKILGEVEGKARIKCKMARCGVMNVIDTDAGLQWREPNPLYGHGELEPLIPLNEIAKEFINQDVRERLDYVPIAYKPNN